MRVPLVTILAREMRLKFFEVDQRLEMLRVALVTILAREMRLKFFEVDQRLEMLRVALVTILAREMRLKFFQVDQASEMLRVLLVTILGEKCDWIFSKFFEVDQRLEMLRVALVTILAREMRLKVFSTFWCQTANNVTSRARKISLKFVEKMAIFIRIYRANIVYQRSSQHLQGLFC